MRWGHSRRVPLTGWTFRVQCHRQPVGEKSESVSANGSDLTTDCVHIGRCKRIRRSDEKSECGTDLDKQKNGINA